jgi:hypothetical protein
VGADAAAGEALPDPAAFSAGDCDEGGRGVSAISFGAGFCAELARSGRSSMVERRGVMLVWDVVPSREDREIPSCDVFMLSGPLACLDVSDGVCFQGHHANTLRSQRFIVCVIMFPCLNMLAITRYKREKQ